MIEIICIFPIDEWGHYSVLHIIGIELDPIDKGRECNFFCLDLKK